MYNEIKRAVKKLCINDLEIIELYYLTLLLKELEEATERKEVLKPEDYCD